MSAHTVNAKTVRSYLAGGGATAALVAGAVVAFLSVAALFAFNGLPGDSGPADEDTLFVGPGGDAPVAAATAVAAAPGAVAADPAALSPAAVAALLAATAPDGSAPAGAPDDFVAPVDGGQDAVAVAEGAPPAQTPGTSTQAPIGGLVDDVDQTAGNLGIDLDLGQATKPITDPIDQTLQETVPGVGGAVDPLGKAVTETVNGVLGSGAQ